MILFPPARKLKQQVSMAFINMLPQITSWSLSLENNGLHAFLWGAFVLAILQGGMWVNPWSRTALLFLWSWPAASSSLSELHAGPLHAALLHFRHFSTPASPANPTQAAGRDLHCLCYVPDKCLQHLWSCPYQNAKEKMLLYPLAYPVPLQPSSSSFFFSTFVTHTDNKTTCSLSWKALSPTETSQELSCQDSQFGRWIHGDVC